MAPPPIGRGPASADADAHWLGEAIEAARRCPPTDRAFSVGAVIVGADGAELARGHSRETDAAVHAEESALAKVADRRALAGATIYSTLEPCGQRASRPRSCAQLILEAGLTQVVFGVREPTTFVADPGGRLVLADAGVEVVERPDVLRAAGRRVGVTGHMDLAPGTVPLVRAELARVLAAGDGRPVVGISCLAPGADTLFAQAVLDLAGLLEVVIPSADYRAAQVGPGHAATFDALTARAAAVTTLPRATADRAAYEAANELVLGSCGELVAVWDGVGPAERGGTAATVAEATRRGLPVTVVWQPGWRRA